MSSFQSCFMINDGAKIEMLEGVSGYDIARG